MNMGGHAYVRRKRGQIINYIDKIKLLLGADTKKAKKAYFAHIWIHTYMKPNEIEWTTSFICSSITLSLGDG